MKKKPIYENFVVASKVNLKCTMLMGEIQNMTTSKQKSIEG